jgi:hypothetical protein
MMMTAGIGLLAAMGSDPSKYHIVMRRVASTIIERSIP